MKSLFTNLTLPTFSTSFRFFFEPIKVFFRIFSLFGCILSPYLIFFPLDAMSEIALTTHSSKFSGIFAGPDWITSVMRTIPPIRFRSAVGFGISVLTTKPSNTSSTMESGSSERISALARPFA